MVWAAASKTAVARPRDWTAWLKACALETPERIGLAVDRYLAHCAETGDRPYSLRNWLGDQRWEPWLADGYVAPGSDRPRWDGPGEIRDAVVFAKSEPFAISWIDDCHWDGARKAIVAPRAMTAQRLGESGLRQALHAAGVAEIVVRSKVAAP